ncbi:MAG: hypothetical protein HRU06_14265 [Oceanospirillaceae bacterium]|nr:hypothetical protein [Oceanospirillaceae bacterium]
MNNTTRSYGKETGLGLISAIFVITILALLAAGMAAMVSDSAKNHTAQLLSVRANSAALAALDIALVKMRKHPNCITERADIVFDTQGLYECIATVSCASTSHQGKFFIELSSAASCGSGMDQASSIVRKRILK